MSPSGDGTCSLIMKFCWTWLLFGQYLRSSVGNGSCWGRSSCEGLQKEGVKGTWRPLGDHLELIWRPIGALGDHLEPTCSSVGGHLEPLGGHLEPTWST